MKMSRVAGKTISSFLVIIMGLASLGFTTTAIAAKADDPVGDKIFYNRTYEELGLDAFSKLNPVPKSNSITLEKEEDGNHYLQMLMEDTIVDDCYIDMSLTDVKKYMIVQADFSTAGSVAKGNIQYKDSQSTTRTLVKLGPSIQAGSEEYGTIEKGKWTNVALAIDLTAATYDLYVDRQLVKENISINGANQNDSMTFLRIYLDKSNARGDDLLLDNYWVYEGAVPRELEPYVPVTGFYCCLVSVLFRLAIT